MTYRRSYYMYAPNDAGRLEWLVQVQNCIGDLIERQINGEKVEEEGGSFYLLLRVHYLLSFVLDIQNSKKPVFLQQSNTISYVNIDTFQLDDTDEEFGLLSKDGKSKAITLDDFQVGWGDWVPCRF